ncbi:unnamed protein product [Rotaria sp. Silwood2]|nr:unnamed protein product [Rotaria sp. Silwood2]CAF3156384.1 unnamed protein product [Rotaria sp. Silwood2]CAF3411701.1 unnamed protein product [Rotaria sp. Silwood2]CAF4366185.1 unnamed protein product [Rotaria sp. Silwood2]CAF4450866.1 unnamed protein product [Rotaria sp. Silwood2]
MADSERQYQEKFKQLMEERRKWDEEKATIEKIAASASPIVKLNVGGEAMTTSRATLTLDEGSLLATMFSGKWDNKLMKDTDGCIFLDYDPVLFKFLLNQLRAWSDLSVKRVFRLPVGSEQSFLELVRLLKFNERFIDSKQSTITSVAKVVQSEEESERFGTVSSSTVQLTNDNRTCKTTVDSNWQYLLGTLTYSTGKHRIRLKLEFGRTNILMGICSQNKPPTGPQFYDKPTTHGWFIHGYMMKNGQGSHPGWPQVAVNDILELTINCDERSLSILNENSRAQNNMQPGLSGGIKGNKK